MRKKKKNITTKTVKNQNKVSKSYTKNILNNKINILKVKLRNLRRPTYMTQVRELSVKKKKQTYEES